MGRVGYRRVLTDAVNWILYASPCTRSVADIRQIVKVISAESIAAQEKMKVRKSEGTMNENKFCCIEFRERTKRLQRAKLIQNSN